MQLTQEMFMFTKNHLIGLVGVGFLAGAVPAMAQVTPGSQEIHVYAGEAFGDELSDRRINGRKPELDDDVTYGLRYGYNFTDTWGIEVSLGRLGSHDARCRCGLSLQPRRYVRAVCARWPRLCKRRSRSNDYRDGERDRSSADR
jgi:hypothetical protein